VFIVIEVQLPGIVSDVDDVGDDDDTMMMMMIIKMMMKMMSMI